MRPKTNIEAEDRDLGVVKEQKNDVLKSPTGILPKIFIGAVAIMILIAVLGSLTTQPTKPMVIASDDTIAEAMAARYSGRNYNEPVALRASGKTTLFLYDCSSIDGDGVVINGLTIPSLPGPSSPIKVTTEATHSFVATSVNDGKYGPATIGITSELGSRTCAFMRRGDTITIPTVIR